MSDINKALSEYARKKHIRTMIPFMLLVEQQIMERQGFKIAKDWKKADAIRDDLLRFGFKIEETRESTRVSIPDTDISWSVITDLGLLVQRAKAAGMKLSGFVPHNLSPELLAEEAEYYRQKAEREAADASQ